MYGPSSVSECLGKSTQNIRGKCLLVWFEVSEHLTNSTILRIYDSGLSLDPVTQKSSGPGLVGRHNLSIELSWVLTVETMGRDRRDPVQCLDNSSVSELMLSNL